MQCFGTTILCNYCISFTTWICTVPTLNSVTIFKPSYFMFLLIIRQLMSYGDFQLRESFNEGCPQTHTQTVPKILLHSRLTFTPCDNYIFD